MMNENSDNKKEHQVQNLCSHNLKKTLGACRTNWCEGVISYTEISQQKQDYRN